MNQSQITLVQESFARVAPNAAAVADLFYARLFQLDPSLRAMFPGDMVEQKRKLMAMLTLAVRGLEKPEALIPTVQALGARHAGYGVQPQQYQTVGAALLWTLEKGLGEDWTPELAAAWTETFMLLAREMQGAPNQLWFVSVIGINLHVG